MSGNSQSCSGNGASCRCSCSEVIQTGGKAGASYPGARAGKRHFYEVLSHRISFYLLNTMLPKSIW